MMLSLFQVLFLLISPSFQAFQGPPIRPPTRQGPPIRPPTRQVTASPTDSNIKTWLNTPENMASLWSLGKSMLNNLPAPRNVPELDDTFTNLKEILEKKVELVHSIIKLLENGGDYDLEAGLESLGPEPAQDILKKLLVAEDVPQVHNIL